MKLSELYETTAALGFGMNNEKPPTRAFISAANTALGSVNAVFPFVARTKIKAADISAENGAALVPGEGLKVNISGAFDSSTDYADGYLVGAIEYRGRREKTFAEVCRRNDRNTESSGSTGSNGSVESSVNSVNSVNTVNAGKIQSDKTIFIPFEFLGLSDFCRYAPAASAVAVVTAALGDGEITAEVIRPPRSLTLDMLSDSLGGADSGNSAVIDVMPEAEPLLVYLCAALLWGDAEPSLAETYRELFASVGARLPRHPLAFTYSVSVSGADGTLR